MEYSSDISSNIVLTQFAMTSRALWAKLWYHQTTADKKHQRGQRLMMMATHNGVDNHLQILDRRIKHFYRVIRS